MMVKQEFNPNHSINAEIIIKDNATGKEIAHIQAQSFVINFINMLTMAFQNATGVTLCTDTGGTNRTLSASAGDMNCVSGIGASTLGIVVGTGTNAVVLTDTKLQTQIAHGVGAGQLSYGATSFSSPVTVGSDRYFEISRVFTNSSGSAITINEIGIYHSHSTFIFCGDRTINSTVVNNGAAITITYRIKVTV